MLSSMVIETGVYAIVHVASGRTYVGSATRTFRHRWNCHRTHLRGNKHHSKFMQRVWNKYGEEAFEFRVLLHCDPKDAVANEQKFIDELKPVFNTLPFAGTTFGFKHSKETREKMRARRMKDGKKHLVKGEYLTLREIKNKYGFSRACLQERLKRGETGDALVAPHRVSHEGRGQKYLIHGEMIDVACMIEKYGVTEDLVRGRLKSGWSGDDLVAPTTSFAEIGRAVGQRNKEAAVRYEVGGELLTISEIAEKYDLTIGTIRGRLARGEFGLDLVAPPSRPGPGTATKYLVMGEMLTSAEVKEKYGIEEATLRQRIKYGWEGEDLIKPPQKKMFLVRGETLTMTQVSKKYGIAMPTLCQRAKAGKDGEDLIERPIIGRKPTHAA